MKLILIYLLLFFSPSVSARTHQKFIKKAINSTVYVKTYTNDTSIEYVHGTGVVIRKDGYILTCNHVIKRGTKYEIIYKRDTINAKLIGVDSMLDIAILKIDKDLPYVKINSKKTKICQNVFTIGYPLQLNLLVNSGIISGYYFERNVNFIETDAVINPGNSGGGLFDEKGRLIGINFLMVSYTDYYIGYGFTIPINPILESINNILCD